MKYSQLPNIGSRYREVAATGAIILVGGGPGSRPNRGCGPTCVAQTTAAGPSDGPMISGLDSVSCRSNQPDQRV